MFKTPTNFQILMKHSICIVFVLLSTFHVCAQEDTIDTQKIEEDFEQMISDLKNNYIYLEDKNVDINCIYKQYKAKIKNITTKEQRLLFFEYLLDEFYDSHAILMRAIWDSYRLDSPIFTITKEGITKITQVWTSQLDSLNVNILGAQVLKINGIDILNKIEEFPTSCADKNHPETRNWIANKVISGKYSEPRILMLKLTSGEQIEFNLDTLKPREDKDLLTVTKRGNIGIIRLNNSLGNNFLIDAFDAALGDLMTTDGLILDLRNTTGGGNTYVARGIMSRFINESLPYQIHQVFDEQWDNQPIIKRRWAEYVSPRGMQYDKPLVVLVGRWTGSMGEGMTIGFDGMNRADIVGTEMKRLAGGSTNDFHLKNENLNYKIMTEKLFHLNGTPRELYAPEHYVNQSSIKIDETLEKGIEIILNKQP